MNIAVSHTGYPITRNILHKVKNAKYTVLKKNNNLFHSLSTIKNFFFKKKIDFDGKYYFYKNSEIDVLHLYNDVNYSSRRWVSSFETLVPRFLETKNDHQKTIPSHTKNEKTRKAFFQITKKNCLGIIAISQASANIQLELLKNYPEYEKEVKEKLHIIHPPQKLILTSAPNQDYKKLKFIFIGNQFHLKGGVQMIEVLVKLKEKYDFELKIISSFKGDAYVTKVSDAAAQDYERSLKDYEWIKFYKNIPNDQVLSLIQESHIGLLPTWSDTYGFSVLEMQACGVPVITTDVRALPEINNTECGWLIHLPQNRLKQALYFDEQQVENLKSCLKMQLEKTLTDIFEQKNQIAIKAKNAIERIKREHHPDNFEKKLFDIYTKKI